jgi:hypothetical protein
MRGHGAKFGRKKEDAIVALMTHRTIEEAARSIGIDPNTLLRWIKLPEFKTALREARREAYGQAIARLEHASGAAVTTVLRVMTDQNASASSRVRAADCILDHARHAIEVEDIEVRVEALEQAADQSKTHRHR